MSVDVQARQRLYAAPGRDWLVPAASMALAGVLAAGWLVREEQLLSPERGLGYALGITGLCLLIGLLGYSVRKRVRWFHGRGALRHWFRVHMLLGILGPSCILLHSNFSLGSLNSSIALACMLSVAASGYVGRFIYTKIHRGLFGRRRHVEDVRREAEYAWSGMRAALDRAPELEARLEAFEAWAARPTHALAGAARFVSIGPRTRLLHRAASRALRQAADGEDRWFLEVAVGEYLHAIRRLTRFQAYERLFSLWHAIHLPLCFVLFGAAAAHVVAVHMY